MQELLIFIVAFMAILFSFPQFWPLAYRLGPGIIVGLILASAMIGLPILLPEANPEVILVGLLLVSWPAIWIAYKIRNGKGDKK